MSEKTGTTIFCNGTNCQATVFDVEPSQARASAVVYGWTRHDNGRDFCRDCSAIRTKRKPLRELVDDGTQLYTAFDAAESLGWERRDEGGTTAHFFCCGAEVEVSSMLGDAYAARCKTCGASIYNVLRPSFGNSWVSFPDPDKVDTEDPLCWAATPGTAVETAEVNP